MDNIFSHFCRNYVEALNWFNVGDAIDTKYDKYFKYKSYRPYDDENGKVYEFTDDIKKDIFGREKELTVSVNLPEWFYQKAEISFTSKDIIEDSIKRIREGYGTDEFGYPKDIIKTFAEFIINTSKYYFVDVDSLDNFTILNHDQYSISVLIEKEDVKVKYEFIESAINLPGKNGFNLSKDNPLAFINDESTENKTVEFINITVMDKDDSVVDEFKYVYGQRLDDESIERTNLFDYIIELSKIVIFDTFMDILNKYVIKRTKFYMETGRIISVKDFLDDGSYSFWR